MRLIIDIDKEIYKRFAKAPRTTNFNECISDRNVFCKAIAKGIPLDDVKAKIGRYIAENKDSEDLYLAGCGDGAYHALAIIEQTHLGGSSNEI